MHYAHIISVRNYRHVELILYVIVIHLRLYKTARECKRDSSYLMLVFPFRQRLSALLRYMIARYKGSAQYTLAMLMTLKTDS